MNNDPRKGKFNVINFKKTPVGQGTGSDLSHDMPIGFSWQIEPDRASKPVIEPLAAWLLDFHWK
jgi:hypothetical protein